MTVNLHRQHMRAFLMTITDDEDPELKWWIIKDMEGFKDVKVGLSLWVFRNTIKLVFTFLHTPSVCVCQWLLTNTLFSGNTHSSVQENRRGWAGEGERRGRAEAAGKPLADPAASVNSHNRLRQETTATTASIRAFTMATIQKTVRTY